MDTSENDAIIRQEMEAIKAEIIQAYNASGKRTSGEFEQGLELSYGPNHASLSGYLYLGGRAAGKQPPIEAIEKWLNQKGIVPHEAKMKVSTLAYLISRKIAREGTNPENHLYIYEQVITPERIDSILEKLNKVNVNWFIGEVSIMINKLVTQS